VGKFITFRRWRLKENTPDAEVLLLVRDEIAPAYARLSPHVKLGLDRIADSDCFIATQEWHSRTAYEQAVGADSYASWLQAYQPALARWHTLLELEDEWEAERLIDPAGN
jgi:hypothetical protein